MLTNSLANRGTAFTIEQRKALGLTGLLPSGVMTITDQLKRVYAQYSAQPDDLAKYLYLNHMHDRNEVLYFRLLAEHIEEMLPIVYTPTIGKAIEEYSHWYDRPRGIYTCPSMIRKTWSRLSHSWVMALTTSTSSWPPMRRASWASATKVSVASRSR
ncbi:putative NAD-dependent malic enzyme 3 [Cutibacterium acnes HL110PA4]|nr:putative NAD-dependent malic enzyme 3 [Cutibacterium acnes HL110PA4]